MFPGAKIYFVWNRVKRASYRIDRGFLHLLRYRHPGKSRIQLKIWWHNLHLWHVARKPRARMHLACSNCMKTCNRRSNTLSSLGHLHDFCQHFCAGVVLIHLEISTYKINKTSRTRERPLPHRSIWRSTANCVHSGTTCVAKQHTTHTTTHVGSKSKKKESN